VADVDCRRWIFAAALAAALATPVQAAPVTPDRNAAGEALILIPLTLTKIDDLDFGSVVTSPVSGMVAIDASTGARTIAGGLTGLPSDVGRRAWFGGGGSPNQFVIINLTSPAVLTSTAGDTLPVLALTLDGPAVRRIDPVTRTFFFGVGGIIMVNANQPEGVYSSEFDVTVDYQ
jgi:hypothetical protein